MQEVCTPQPKCALRRQSYIVVVRGGVTGILPGLRILYFFVPIRLGRQQDHERTASSYLTLMDPDNLDIHMHTEYP